MEKSKIDLLPCPFCGRMPKSDKLNIPLHIIGCSFSKCHAHPWVIKETPEEAAKAWNTRASGWIPCSEMMPEDGEEVLFAVAYPWDKGKKPKVALGRHYTKNGKGWWTAYYGAFLDYEVTRWMPLPEPPETEDKS